MLSTSLAHFWRVYLGRLYFGRDILGSSMAVLPVKNWFNPPASCYSQAWIDRAHVGHQSHVTADALKQLCKLVLKYSRHCYDVYTQKNLSEQNKCVGKSSYIKLANLVPKITTKNNAFCMSSCKGFYKYLDDPCKI